MTTALATKLQLADIFERSLEAGVPGAAKAMENCIEKSERIYCGMLDGVPACAWGLIPGSILSDRAYLWLITTEIVAQHKFMFVRWSQMIVEEALETYPMIYGECHKDTKSAQRWLKWLGAEFGDTLRKDHLPFQIRKK